MRTFISIIILSLSLTNCGGSKLIESKEENTTKTTEQVEETVQQERQSIFDAVDEQKSSLDNPAVGTWEISVESPRGTRNSTLVISQENGKLKGEGDSGYFTITQDGNKLSWTSSMSGPMGSMSLQNEAEINGNKMSGTVKMSSGPMAGRSMNLSGVRQ